MVTKRQLGYVFVAVGILIFFGTFIVDWIGAGNFSGIGPYQRLALVGSILTFFVGLTLLPLGDRPA